MGILKSIKDPSPKVNWVKLTSPQQLTDLLAVSHEKPVVFFKHSTRCSLSFMVKNRLESDWDLSNEAIIPVYLDLIRYRTISNEMADLFEIRHESPQLILVKDERPVYNASHGAISVGALKQNL